MNRPKGLPARKGGAKALLLTVLGEFVLPAGGEAWTSTLVTAAATLGVGEKNARQALARIGEQGFIERNRRGRSVRWALTAPGRDLLEAGTQRIYDFGTRDVSWNGQWLIVHCPVAETQRAVRNELRTALQSLGFGELSATLLVSPHGKHDAALRDVLRQLDLLDESTVLRATTVGDLEDRDLVAKAWSLDELADTYDEFSNTHRSVDVSSPRDAFKALVGLVHDWRRFPYTDPELPTQLLPAGWAGAHAAKLFHQQHALLNNDAQNWFLDHERVTARSSG